MRRWRKIKGYELRSIAGLAVGPVTAWHERARWLLIAGVDFDPGPQEALVQKAR